MSDYKVIATKLMALVVDYAEYEWSGDPWEEDARQMGEMEIDDFKRTDEYQSLKEELLTSAPVRDDGE